VGKGFSFCQEQTNPLCKDGQPVSATTGPPAVRAFFLRAVDTSLAQIPKVREKKTPVLQGALLSLKQVAHLCKGGLSVLGKTKNPFPHHISQKSNICHDCPRMSMRNQNLGLVGLKSENSGLGLHFFVFTSP
jgi:hypothetical protein